MRSRIIVLLLIAALAPAAPSAASEAEALLRRDLTRAARTAAVLETRAVRAEAAAAALRRQWRRAQRERDDARSREQALAGEQALDEARSLALEAQLAEARRIVERSRRTALRVAGLRRIDEAARVRFVLPATYFEREGFDATRVLEPIVDALDDLDGAVPTLACHWDRGDAEWLAQRRCREQLFLLRNAAAEAGLYSPPHTDRLRGDEPLYPGDDQLSRSENRRVEVVLLRSAAAAH